MTVTIDSSRLSAALQSLGRELSDPSDALTDIGRELTDQIRARLGRGIRYDGAAMKPLKVRHGVPLNDTRQHIYNRITSQLIGRDTVAVGMNDGKEHIGAVHQFGAKIDHHAQSRLQSFKVNFSTGRSRFASRKKANFEQWTSRGAYQTEIPPRPFLPIDPGGNADLPQEWETDLIETIKAALAESIKA